MTSKGLPKLQLYVINIIKIRIYEVGSHFHKQMLFNFPKYPNGNEEDHLFTDLIYSWRKFVYCYQFNVSFIFIYMLMFNGDQ